MRARPVASGEGVSGFVEWVDASGLSSGVRYGAVGACLLLVLIVLSLASAPPPARVLLASCAR